MKRFGVQMAGSGIVILLGALGVAQAQRDSRTAESTQWDAQSVPALTPPPAPIEALEPEDQDVNSGPVTQGFGSFGMPPVTDHGVRTVNHEEPIAMPAASPESFGPSTFGMPTAPRTDAPPQLEAMPTWSMPAAPEMPPADAANTSPPSHGGSPMGGFAAMPTLQFDAAPPDASHRDAPNDDAMNDRASPSNDLRSATPSHDAPPDYHPEPMLLPLEPSPGTIPPIAAPIPYPELNSRPTYEAGPTAGFATTVPAGRAPEARIASLPHARLPNLSAAPVGQRLTESVLAEPGDRRLEGMQSPSIVIQKRAPGEVKVGKPATFIISVQNAGGVEALDVRVHDRIPVGTRFVDASPQPAMQADLLTWELGAIEPGGERTITVQLVPEQEGELGSVARVTFEAAASVRTISTRPELKITQRAPTEVLIGQQLEIELEVSNPGSGAATGVVMQEDVPEGLEHPKGRQLDNVIGTLAPGEVRRQVLRLRAVGPGKVENRIRLTGDDGLQAEHSVIVDVVAPQLAIELEGPSRRYLERQATFNINLANVGTADATNVEVVAYLDRGFSFVGTEFQGQYDPNRHAVYWSLENLPADGRGSVPLKLLPIQQGDRAIRLEAKGDLNMLAQSEKIVSVETLAELTFSITDDADPIEIGSEATYEIVITNRGSRDDSDVKLQMMLPPGLQLVASEAEASTNDRGLIAFAPTLSLPAGKDAIHRVRVRGVAAGTHVVKAIVTSAQATTPVTKEESTMVYADQ